MTGTLKDILAFDVISLARSTPSGDYPNLDHVQPADEFVIDVDLAEDQVADVGAWASDHVEMIDGYEIHFSAYADLWLNNNPDAPTTRYVLGNFR